jgi:hypothetical protein
MPTYERVLVLSTRHIPDDSNIYEDEHLDFEIDMPRVSTHAEGWWVFLPSFEDDPEDDPVVPEWFLPILDIAQKNDCSFINFDSAGQVLSALPTYDW